MRSPASRCRWQPFGAAVVCGGTANALMVTTVGFFQVPLPNSVFVNTTESCEVERSV